MRDIFNKKDIFTGEFYSMVEKKIYHVNKTTIPKNKLKS